MKKINIIMHFIFFLLFLLIYSCAGSAGSVSNPQPGQVYSRGSIVLHEGFKLIKASGYYDGATTNFYPDYSTPLLNQKIMGQIMGQQTEIMLEFYNENLPDNQFTLQPADRRNTYAALTDIIFVDVGKSIRDLVEPKIIKENWKILFNKKFVRKEWTSGKIVNNSDSDEIFPFHHDLKNGDIFFKTRGGSILSINYNKGEIAAPFEDKWQSKGFYFSKFSPNIIVSTRSYKIGNLVTGEVYDIEKKPKRLYPSYSLNKYPILFAFNRSHSVDFYQFDSSGFSIKYEINNPEFENIMQKKIRSYKRGNSNDDTIEDLFNKIQISDNRLAIMDEFGSLFIFRLDKNCEVERKFGSLIFKNNGLTENDLTYLNPFNLKLLKSKRR